MNVLDYLKNIEITQLYSFEGFPLLYVLAFLPGTFLSIAIVYVIVYASFLVAAKKCGYPILTFNILNLSLLIIITLIIFVLLNPMPSLHNPIFILESSFILDNLAFYGQIVLLVFSLISLISIRSYIHRTQMNTYEFFLFILGCILAGSLLMISNSFLTFYIALELQSLLLYLIAGLRSKSILGTEAAIKYFVFGSIASSFILLGFCLIYGLTGMTTLEEIGQFFLNINVSPFSVDSVQLWVYISIMFLLIGLFLKMGIVPFHFWVPDVYEGAPLMSTIFYTFLPKISVLVPLIRFAQTSFIEFIWVIEFIFILFGFYSIVIGTLYALNQTRLKRLFAYSAITNIGYVIIPVGLTGLENMCSGLVFFCVYTLVNSGLWLILLSVYNSQGLLAFRTIGDLTGLFYRSPFLACSMAILLFSIAGIPPFVGFFLKLNIITSLINESYFFFAFLILIFGVLSCFYYLRLIKIMFFEKTQNNEILQMDFSSIFMLSLILFFVFLFSYSPMLIFYFFFI